MKKEEKNVLITYVMGIMTFIVVILLWMFCAIYASAQSVQVQRKGNTFIELVDSGHKTAMVYIDKDGKKYPIYVSAKGKHYILKVSKKSGKVYKKYLKKVDEQLSNK